MVVASISQEVEDVVVHEGGVVAEAEAEEEEVEGEQKEAPRYLLLLKLCSFDGLRLFKCWHVRLKQHAEASRIIACFHVPMQSALLYLELRKGIKNFVL